MGPLPEHYSTDRLKEGEMEKNMADFSCSEVRNNPHLTRPTLFTVLRATLHRLLRTRVGNGRLGKGGDGGGWRRGGADVVFEVLI